MNGQLILLGIGSLITSPTVIAIAIVVLALVVAIGGFLVYRSGGKKGAKAGASAVNSDWQRQLQGQQQGGANGWNAQQGINNDGPAWAQQSQGQQGGWNQNGQQQGWNAPQQNGQMQQQNASSWNNSQGANPSWSNAQGQGGMPQQQASWNDAGMPQQQQASWNDAGQQQQASWNGGMQNGNNSWAAAANPGMQQANQWDAQGNPNSMNGGSAWNAAPAQAAQEPWGQPSQSSPQQQWGGQANAAMPQQQQAPTSFSGGSGPSWNQQGFAGTSQNGQNAQGVDGWGTPQQQQYAPQGANNSMGGFNSVPQAPSWQQQQGGFNQGGQPNQAFGDNGFAMNDGDKTMMRSPSGLGLVRVEEGKEPGREYKIVKESLSIGRSRESDIFLEDLAVSRLHASVVNLGNGQYALKDEGSANGTKVNGQMVGKFQTFPLQEGDRIQLGQTVLVFARS